MIYQGKEFKPYDTHYFVSQDGEVYSAYKHGLLKQSIDVDGYHRVDVHSKHMKVHKLVYLTWIGDIPDGMQVNHIDDDKDNNSLKNLYLGTQKENTADRIRNGHNVGNVFSIVVFDKVENKVFSYGCIKDFLASSGHHVSNGSLSRCLHRKWFKNRFEIIKLERCRDYRNQLGNPTESRVVRNVSPHEARGTA